MRFWKVQAIGNDFPLVRSEDVDASSLSGLAISMADRRFGVGGDGLLAVGFDPDGELRLRMFNPDGTEDFCGNGLRAAAWWVYREGLGGKAFDLRHLDRTVPVEIAGSRVSTQLGLASYSPTAVPHTLSSEAFDVEIVPGRQGSALTTGSTHTVLWVDELPLSPAFEAESEALEHDARFPLRTSVIWAQQEGEDALSIRIWERGVGETLGCGTGSTAATADFMRRRGVGGEVAVRNPGGTVIVSARDWESPFTISGEAEIVYSGQWSVRG